MSHKMYVNIILSINSKLKINLCKKNRGQIKKKKLKCSKSKFMKNMEKSKKYIILHKMYVNITLSINSNLEFDVCKESIG